jgi:hypothetical protein
MLKHYFSDLWRHRQHSLLSFLQAVMSPAIKKDIETAEKTIADKAGFTQSPICTPLFPLVLGRGKDCPDTLARGLKDVLAVEH